MIQIAEFSSKPSTVKVCALPDGKCDIWVRRNIEAIKHEGGDRWYAEEAYMRTESPTSEVEIQKNFAQVWAEAAKWINEQSTQDNRQTEIDELKRKVDWLQRRIIGL